MRIFDHPNMTGGFTCPICKGSEDAPVTLIGLEETRDGMTLEAMQIHVSCLDLSSVLLPDGRRLIIQQIERSQSR